MAALIALGEAKVEQGKNDPLTVQLMKEGVIHLEKACSLAETNTDVSHDLLTQYQNMQLNAKKICFLKQLAIDIESVSTQLEDAKKKLGTLDKLMIAYKVEQERLFDVKGIYQKLE